MKTTRAWIARTVVPIALAGACASLAPACSDDATAPSPDGGPDSGVPGAGGKAAGGGGNKAGAGGGENKAGAGGASAGGASAGGASTGGASAGGAQNAGGKSGASHVDASVPDGGPDAMVDAGPGPADVLCADGGVPTSALLVAGTNYCEGCLAELAAVDLEHGCVIGRSIFADSDIVPRSSGGHGFVLERTNGVLDTLDLTAKATARIDLHSQDGGKDQPNPHDVVYVKPQSGPAKAYVSLYNEGKIAIVDLDSAAHPVSFIDLSSYTDPSDTDNSPDPDVGFYDATKGRVYFVMQRTDANTAFTGPGIIHCPPVPSVLVGIDVTTDKLVHLGGGAGDALPLKLVAPADVAVDTAGRRALLVANGCGIPDGTDGGLERTLGGVESVNLDNLATQVAFTPTTQDFYSRIVMLGSNSALLQSFDGTFATLWNEWQPSTPTLGAALTGVPVSAVAEGPDSVVGVSYLNGRARVERYQVSTQSTSKVVSAPWTGDFLYTAGVALVK